MSTTKAEYVSCALQTMEAIWIRRFVLYLGLIPNARDHIPLKIDSTTAICLAKDPSTSSQGETHQMRVSFYSSTCIRKRDSDILYAMFGSDC